jgi:undecaprenyl-diphosphatase
LSLILEAASFITVTWLVGRPRPDVPRLEGSPVDSSFPSGHAAAAAAYGALVVIVFRHTDRRWVRLSVVAICVAIPAIVGLSRMYRGMHYLSDVLAGVVLGVVSVAITSAILSPEVRRTE